MFLKPDYNLKDIYEIDFKELKAKGIKAILFDFDGGCDLLCNCLHKMPPVSYYNCNIIIAFILSGGKLYPESSKVSVLFTCKVSET